MIAAFVLFLAQGLVIDGTRYHIAEDGRLQATRVDSEKVLYQWWPDPPARPLTGRLTAGVLPRQKVLAAGLGREKGLYVLDVTNAEQQAPEPLSVLVDEDVVGHVSDQLIVATVGPNARPFVLSSAGLDAPRPGLLMVPLDRSGHHLLEVHSPGATLGAVAVARHADGRVLYAYAGDSMGRLWRFDLTGETPWSQARQRKPIFSATRADGSRQPIVIAPSVMFGPDGGYLLAFGTSASHGNTLYAFHDRMRTPDNANREDLVKRAALPYLNGVRIEGRPFNYARHRGWYLDLTCGTGERMAGLDAKGGLLIASTTLEEGDGGCTYVLLPVTGLPPDRALTGKRMKGLLENAELIAIGPEEVIESTPFRSTRQRNYQLVRRDADGNVHKLQEVRTVRRYGRLSWREIPHWRALHHAARRPP
jgi:type IV pilus assembly protein PilY1